MFINKKAMASYGGVKHQAGVAYADGARLTQMLYDGLCDALVLAEGYMARREVAEKGEAVNRAMRILFGLKGTLDFEQGGDVALALDEFYTYATRRLLAVSAENDLDGLREVRGQIDEIRLAWAQAVVARGAPADEAASA